MGFFHLVNVKVEKLEFNHQKITFNEIFSIFVYLIAICKAIIGKLKVKLDFKNIYLLFIASMLKATDFDER